MATRGRKRLTTYGEEAEKLEEKIRSLFDRIENLKEEKEKYQKLDEQERLTEIKDLVDETGLSIEELREIIKKQNITE
jgi:predicted RNA binding protein with dsRBD fold (UPF0201 family)